MKIWLVYHSQSCYECGGAPELRAICSTPEAAETWLTLTDPCPETHEREGGEHWVWDPESVEMRRTFLGTYGHATRKMPASALDCINASQHRADEFTCCYVEEMELDPQMPPQLHEVPGLKVVS